jgi:hypothetical protein
MSALSFMAQCVQVFWKARPFEWDWATILSATGSSLSTAFTFLARTC